jgi:hypothetical protein
MIASAVIVPDLWRVNTAGNPLASLLEQQGRSMCLRSMFPLCTLRKVP